MNSTLHLRSLLSFGTSLTSRLLSLLSLIVACLEGQLAFKVDSYSFQLVCFDGVGTENKSMYQDKQDTSRFQDLFENQVEDILLLTLSSRSLAKFLVRQSLQNLRSQPVKVLVRPFAPGFVC